MSSGIAQWPLGQNYFQLRTNRLSNYWTCFIIMTFPILWLLPSSCGFPTCLETKPRACDLHCTNRKTQHRNHTGAAVRWDPPCSQGDRQALLGEQPWSTEHAAGPPGAGISGRVPMPAAVMGNYRGTCLIFRTLLLALDTWNITLTDPHNAKMIRVIIFSILPKMVYNSTIPHA